MKECKNLKSPIVIIVLGYDLTKPFANEILSSRVWTALREYKKLKKKFDVVKLLFTGGNPSKRNILSEGEAMADFAIRYNIPETDIIIETESDDTLENAHFTVKLLKKYNFNSFILISSEFHIERAAFIFDCIFKYNYKNKMLCHISVPNSNIPSEHLGVVKKNKLPFVLHNIKLEEEKGLTKLIIENQVCKK